MKALKLLSTSEVAQAAGVGRETLRLYEEKGLLKPIGRTAAGYRQYTPDAVTLLAFVKETQLAGFTLKEIQELIDLRATAANTCNNVTDILNRKQCALDEEIQRLERKKELLASMMTDCCAVNSCKA